MTDITIPPEAVEAAARGIIDTLHAYAAQNGLTMNGAEEAIEEFREVATAALRAGIAAWPRSYSLAENDSAVIRDVAAIILPLPPSVRC